MKKTLSLCFACVLLLCSLTAFVSCGERPELDLATAAENLEAEGYTVSYYTAEDHDLAEGIVRYLMAYEDPTFIDKTDYFVMEEYDDTKMAKLAYLEQKRLFDTKLEEYEIKIETLERTLELYSDDLSDAVREDYRNQLKFYKKQLEHWEDEFAVGRSGKVIWYGAIDILEDTED